MGAMTRVGPSLLCVVVLAVGCGGGSTTPPPWASIVVLQSMDLPDGPNVVSPAVLGFHVRLAEGPVRVVVRPADPAGASAREAAADPSVIGVVVAPFTIVGSDAMSALAAAGVPVLSLSTLELPAAMPGGVWRRMVPDEDPTATTAVRTASTFGPRTCVLSAPGAWSSLVGAAIIDAGRGEGVEASSSTDGCDAAIWSGPTEGASEVRASTRVPLILTDQARTDGFLSAAPTGTTLGLCGCRDMSTSAKPADQAFVHDYQEATGLDPGPYAVEGYDTAGFVLEALAGGEPSRSAFADAVGGATSYHGVARTYAWGPDGELTVPDVRVYEAVGVRWLAYRARGAPVAGVGGPT